jgi:hypothetical protein
LWQASQSLILSRVIGRALGCANVSLTGAAPWAPKCKLSVIAVSSAGRLLAATLLWRKKYIITPYCQ